MTRKINIGNNAQRLSSITNNATKNNNMEEDTMMDNLTKNNNTGAETMNVTEALEAILSNDLAEMIPENEKAVTAMDPVEENKIVVASSIEPLEDLASEIPEDEREEVAAPPAELAETIKYGYLSPVSNMRGFILDTGVVQQIKDGRILQIIRG